MWTEPRRSGGVDFVFADDTVPPCEGGTIRFPTPPATNAVVILLRDLAIQRTTDFQESGEFRAKTINDELDYQIAALQEIADGNSRAVHLGDFDIEAATELPSTSQRAGKLLAFDSTGNVTVTGTDSLSLATLAAFVDWNVDSFTGDGSNDIFTLSAEPAHKANTQVFIDGVYQSKDNYTLAADTIAFDTPPPDTVAIEVVHGQAVSSMVPASGSVTADLLAATLDLSGKTLTLPALNELGLGTTPATAPFEIDLGGTGGYLFAMTDGVAVDPILKTDGSSKATFGPEAGGTTLALQAAGVERTFIDTGGNLTHGKSTTALGTAGIVLWSTGEFYVTRDDQNCAYFNRLTSDGQIIGIAQDGTTEGTINVSGTTVSYNGAHLSRWAQLPDGTRPDIPRGTVMASVDAMCAWKAVDTFDADGTKIGHELIAPDDERALGTEWTEEIEPARTVTHRVVMEDNEQLTCVQVSDTAGDAANAGVFDCWDDADDPYDDMLIAQSGDFVIRVTGPVANGDLLESAGDGTARVQADAIVRASTIAKACWSDDSTAAEKTIPCLLMAC